MTERLRTTGGGGLSQGKEKAKAEVIAKDRQEDMSKGTGRDIPADIQRVSVPVAVVREIPEREEADKADVPTWNQKKWGKRNRSK